MKNIKKLIALLLIATIITGLTSCKGDGESDPSDTTESTAVTTEASDDTTEEVTTEKEDDKPDALEIYNEAVSKIESTVTYQQDITINAKRTVGTASFDEKYDVSALYIDTDKDSFTACVTEEQTIGNVSFNSRESYIDGTVYLEYTDSDNAVYSAPSAKDEYLENVYPLIPVTASLYESVYFSDKDENTIILEDPTAIEEWLAPEYAILKDASAIVTLNDEGELCSFSYTADFFKGNTDFVYDITFELSFPKEPSKPSAPDSAEIVSFDCIEIPMLMTATFSFLDNRPPCSALIDESALSYVFGDTVILDENNYSYGSTDEDYAAKIEKTLTRTPYGKESTSTTSTTTYIDGKMSVSTSDAEPTTLDAPCDTVKTYIAQSTLNHLTAPGYIKSATLSSTGSFFVIEFTGTDALGEYYEKYTNTFMYGSDGFTRQYLSDYKIDEISGFVSIDPDSLMPTAISIEFQCSYIDGDNSYPMMLVSTLKLNVGDATAYESATGEALPEKEPEETAKPLFYKVTSKEGKTMYLLGTIHIGDERAAYLPKEIYDALEDSDILAVEVDDVAFGEAFESDPQLAALLQQAYYYTDGSTITDHIDSELWEAAILALKAAGYTNLRDDLLPTTVMDLIEEHYMDTAHGLLYDKGVDSRIMDIAREKEITIESIESYEDKLLMYSKYSDGVQEMMLAETLYYTRNQYREGQIELFELWCEGDEEKLKAYLNEDYDTSELTEEENTILEEYEQRMTIERDKIMLDAAIEYLSEDKTVFYAVGLAHLLSETGLVDGLRNAGYTVELIEFE